ncbi:hypothetical protein SSABA_v1c02840 [Spiroplasma sabaudiense Ar-1343]|uniref:Uncharacterized protein n=1 Tax=Spiroplasma sabaudiense Ar-1343 TaxID=1276257 RepID=W6A9Q6_9MOLU|nr:TIGR04561 family membrane protein [Spiroplasma sabaudiense]AHI53696.1 hypothetical protein SSABA_v1c02840 [Spiroplasma sabaudiense Ar-1343]
MNILNLLASLKILDFVIPVWVILLIFVIFGAIIFGLYIYLLVYSKNKTAKENGLNTSLKEKQLYKFEELQSDFEKELAKVKKIHKKNKS